MSGADSRELPGWARGILAESPEVALRGQAWKLRDPAGDSALAGALEAAERDGWLEGIRTLGDDPALLRRVADARAGDFAVLLDLPRDAVVWDCSSDFGDVSIALARMGCRVVGTDVDEARVRFLRIRARQEGLEDRVVSLRSDRLRDVGIREGSLDGVVLRGVPLRIPDLLPTRTRVDELELLKFLAAGLKAAGSLYLTLGRSRHLRAPDPPELLRDPFPAGDPWVSSVRRTERLLAEAGFRDPEAYVLHPRARHVRRMAPWADGRAVEAAFRNGEAGSIVGRAVGWAAGIPGAWKLIRRLTADVAWVARR